jgi:para-nitrobenzyl esterase
MHMHFRPPRDSAAPSAAMARFNRRRLFHRSATALAIPAAAMMGRATDRLHAPSTAATPATPTGEELDAIVATQDGQVRGRVADGVYVFQGVPFAAPPFGPHRLRPPQPVEPWSGVRDALTFGPKSPQPPYPPLVALLLPELVGSSEDCLTLNVWSPELGAAGLPVFVWVPGGQFVYHGTSASLWYDGTQFARDGVVCVTINYRVGADGFLALDDGNANRGLLDQIAALEWVQDNIAAFGGDPGNVTIVGESAGSMSVGTLLVMPRAEGLFRRAIAESGGAHQVIAAEDARRVVRILADSLGAAPTWEALTAVPVDRLLEAQTALDAELYADPDPAQWGADVARSRLAWQPVVDGELIPARPIDRIAAGASADVDIMTGSNADEFNLFLVPDGAIDQITDAALGGLISIYGLPVDAALATYRPAHPGASAGELFSAVQGDWWMRIPALQLADAHAKNTTSAGGTYMYEFAWRSPQFGGRLGAAHGLEIPFVFDTLDHETGDLWGTDPPQALADTMHAAWVAFVTNGEVGWAEYDLTRRATMRFATTSEVVDDPRAAVRILWEGVR